MTGEVLKFVFVFDASETEFHCKRRDTYRRGALAEITQIGPQTGTDHPPTKEFSCN